MSSKPQQILAFTADQAGCLIGLTHRQLRYWNATGFFRGEYESGESPWTGIYSFRDLMILDTLAHLRNKHKVPLRELRRVCPWLREQYRRRTPWSNIRVFVSGKQVYFQEPVSRQTSPRLSGQHVAVAVMDLEQVFHEVSGKVERLRKRQRGQVGRIERQRRVVHNSPAISGTRIPALAVWELDEAGYSTQRILREFPNLTQSDVEAAIAYEEDRRRNKQAS
jgi:uncharacterized protein (DUF433 family)